MNNSTLTPLAVLPHPQEGSTLRSSREPDSTFKLWSYIRDLALRSNKNAQSIQQMSRDIKEIGNRNTSDFDLFPFKIYTLPTVFRPQSDSGNYTSSINWRTVRVRGGLILTDTIATSSFVNGTDMMQNYSYYNMYPPQNIASFDIKVPSGSLHYWFWIEKLTNPISGSSYILRHSNDPLSASFNNNPNTWIGFPTANSNYIPIGYVDTLTSASINRAYVRQMLTNDVISSGGGSGLTYAGIWNTTASYTPNQIVLIEPGNLISTTGYVDSASLASGLTGSAATQSAMPGYYLNLITAAPFTPPSGSFSGSKSYLTASTCWNIPSQPFNNTGSQYWNMIEPYPIQHYFCTDVSNAFDYFTAKTWNGFITGSDSILIAKAPRQRPSVASEIIDGITITYSSYTGSNNRTATDGTNFEFQVVFPRYTTASYLNTSGASFNNNMAIVSAYTPLNGNFVTGSNGKQVYLEECLPHRVWARRYSQ